MTHDDMEDLKADLLDVFQNDIEQNVVYRTLGPTSTKDARFGFVKTAITTDVNFFGVVIMNPDNKTMKTFGVSGDTVMIVYLATKQLDDLALALQPELGTIVFGGVEYEIEKIQPMPLMSGTSVLTVLGCKEAKPNV